MSHTVPACILTVSEESGVPTCDLTTIALVFPEPVGEPYESTVTLAPHVVFESPSERAWYSWTWRSYMNQRRAEWSKGRVEPWPR